MPKKLNNYRSSSTNMIMNRLLSQLALVVHLPTSSAATPMWWHKTRRLKDMK